MKASSGLVIKYQRHCPDCGAFMSNGCPYWEAPHCHNCMRLPLEGGEG